MDGRGGVRVETMFRGSRAPRGRSEDRCDGAGSEADGAKPPVKPGPMLPVLGVLVCVNRSGLVKLPSSGLGIDKARGSPGRFCPALRIYSSSVSEVRERSIWAAFHKGSAAGLARNWRWACLSACDAGRVGCGSKAFLHSSSFEA